MGITGLLPFIEKASRKTNISEFSGSTVAIDSYCWLHKGAFACADRLVRGEETDVHIKYCLKYVTMLLAKNIKPILVFDGRHLPAKALTESKRRESRDISKKRAAELLSLGKIDEARSYMRRSVDITHAMALQLIQECRKRNVDCVVAPYEADAQLAYLNIRNIAHVVITEDSDLILFGCTKVFFKMDLEGSGTLVETIKLPLVMKCPIEHYSFSKFRQMCIMSGCDYISSLPGIGLAKARQFVCATQDPDFANALKKLPSFFNRMSLTVTDEYRENFLKAEATFKHQYVYDPIERKMVRLTEPEDEDIEQALCVNAGEILDPKTAFQLALGNLDPFTLKKMDDWHPDLDRNRLQNGHIKTNNWKDKPVSNHPSIWSEDLKHYLEETTPWQKKVKKVEPILQQPNVRPRKKVVNLVTKYVPETEEQDESLSIEALSNMYCIEPSNKRLKTENPAIKQNVTQEEDLSNDVIVSTIDKEKNRSPILENKERSFKKLLASKGNNFKRLSKFPRTILSDNIVESKFFSTSTESNSNNSIIVEESPEKCRRNPFKVSKSPEENCQNERLNLNGSLCNNIEELHNNNISNSNMVDLIESQSSQKENSPCNSPVKRQSSPILEQSPKTRNPFKRLDAKLEPDIGTELEPSSDIKLESSLSEDSIIENTYPMETLVTPVDSQVSFGQSQPKPSFWSSQPLSQPVPGTNQPQANVIKKSNCRVPGLKRTASLPSNQPTLLSKFGFQKKPALKR